MCGIAGFLRLKPLAPGEERADLARMAQALVHRGPDDSGHWSEPAAGVAFCHRRLSIIDLSPLGHQPMVSASGRYTITFNGEIYNYPALRAELTGRGRTFRGTSDTEVLLSACEEWGVEPALRRAHGMFAFALWDRSERVLHLARDRFGEKPLYYAEIDGVFLFASELKALRVHSAWRADIDRGALGLLLRHGYVPAPHTIFRGVRKLHPGRLLSVRSDGYSLVRTEREYWQPKTLAPPAAVAGTGARRQQQVEHVHSALQRAVGLQMVADVPVGAFLSGGIDSSLIVALMQRTSPRPVRTFSIGFTDERYNEAPFAKAVARHLGTDHTELLVTPEDARAVIPKLPAIYDEPFADSSQIPTFLVCQMARKGVTVALSGDAGDELFGGYTRYSQVPAQWQRMRAWPAPLRRAAAAMVGSLSSRALERTLAPAARWYARPDLVDRLQQRAHAWRARSFTEFCHTATSIWPQSDQCVLGIEDADSHIAAPASLPRHADELAEMMYSDTRVYLPDDILVKVDRAAMAVSLETRVPFLDPEVAEAAWSIDAATHRADGSGKWVLRQLLQRYVPRELFERPKKGFAVPVGQWIRHELRAWARELLDPAELRRQGLLDADLIERRWQQHQSGQTNWTYQLWSVLMFQAWMQHWGTARESRLAA
jgi:asparagine synthase (glutamine-hydrolysing)